MATYSLVKIQIKYIYFYNTSMFLLYLSHNVVQHPSAVMQENPGPGMELITNVFILVADTID